MGLQEGCREAVEIVIGDELLPDGTVKKRGKKDDATPQLSTLAPPAPLEDGDEVS